MSPFIIGPLIGGIMTMWDNATDYGDVDVEQTWFFGPFHVPTLLVSSGAALIAIIGWAMGDPKRTWISLDTVMDLLWAIPIALGTAWLTDMFFIPIYNKVKEAVDLLPDFLKP